MECFTFILMGGTTEQIEVLLLAQEGDGESAMQEELIDSFRHFDASNARCFLQEDTDRLLGTIEGPLRATKYQRWYQQLLNTLRYQKISGVL